MRKSAIALAIVLVAALSSSCAVTGSGYGYDGGGADVGIGLDYYEPYGGYYGGWGSGYNVGPIRGGDHRYDNRGGHGGAPPHYRPAPSSHSAPSIPSHSHSGGPRGH